MTRIESNQHRPSDNQNQNHAKPEDTTATAQKLYSDVQGWFAGGNPTDAKTKLIADGILPAGSSVIDFSTVSQQHDKDTKELGDLSNKTAPDTTQAQKDADAAKKAQSDGKTKLDGAQKDVDTVQKRIDDRKALDGQVKKDLDVVSKANGGKDAIYKSELETMAKDSKQPQEVRDAAQRLLNTWQKPAGSHASASSDYAKGSWMPGWGDYIDKSSVDAGIAKHDKATQADQADLKTKTGARDQLKTQQDGLDTAAKQKQDALDGLKQQGKDLEDRKTALKQHIADEEAALKPASDLEQKGKVVSGGGYYQVAEKLLGVGEKGHSTREEQELKMLTKLLQDEARAEHGGKLPKYLTSGDPLLNPTNVTTVMQKLAAMAHPNV